MAPFPGVSRRHALVRPQAGGVLVTDLGSTNGLTQDGQRVEEVLLTPGSAVGLGQAILVLEDLSSSDAEAALRLRARDSVAPEGRAPRETSPFQPLEAAASPAAALRLVRELEPLGEEALAARRGEIVHGARAALGAESLLALGTQAGGDLSVAACDGPFPAAEAFETITRAAAAVDPDEPLSLLSASDRILLVAARPDGRSLAGVFAEDPEPWQRDFFAYLAERLLPGKSGPGPAASTPAVEEGLLLPPGMVAGTSEAMRELLRQVKATVRGGLNVLLTGETGTGKELFARLIHTAGPQESGPFVAVNCAAIPAELLEAELFGIAGRVATGVAPRPGLFLQANGGAIFLDEISEMPERLQAKLLRVLQEREVLPLGAPTPKKVSVQIVAASNRDLRQLIREGRFRADLYYRLRGVELRLPPLRERREDIPHLVLAFASRAAARHRKHVEGVSRRALAALMEHDWPGNVRELESEVERAVLLCPDGGLLQREHFGDLGDAEPERAATARPEADPSEPADLPAPPETLQERVDAVERQAILDALGAAGRNKTDAARRLGITRNGLALKMKRLGLLDG